jgi:hypothetical protein
MTSRMRVAPAGHMSPDWNGIRWKNGERTRQVVPDVSHIAAARVLFETAHGHVFDHARPQWADGPR